MIGMLRLVFGYCSAVLGTSPEAYFKLGTRREDPVDLPPDQPMSATIHRITKNLFISPPVGSSKRKSGNLMKILFHLTKIDLILALCSAAIVRFLLLLQPVLLEYFLAYIESGVAVDRTLIGGFAFRGMLLVVGLGGSLFLSNILSAVSYHHINSAALSARTALCVLIAEKNMTLSASARLKHSIAEVTTLLTTDTENVLYATTWSSDLLLGPAVTLIAFVYLVSKVGVSALICILLLLFLWILQWLVIQYSSNVRGRAILLAETRIDQLNELLGGIRTIKCYGWEALIKRRIDRSREREERELETFAFLSVTNKAIDFITPFVLSLGVFGTYYLLGKSIDSIQFYSMLSLMNIITSSAGYFNYSLGCFLIAGGSLAKIETYLSIDDVYPSTDVSSQPTEGTCLWGSVLLRSVKLSLPSALGDSPCSVSLDPVRVFRSVTCMINKGDLVAVLGPAGSGKSLLLMALLGELSFEGGDVRIAGSMSYFSQCSWLTRHSLQANILFYSPYNDTKYQRILAACRLTKDISTFPGGDQVEILEGGKNLSGGQRARVALARAMYQEADIYMLDDPLAALDSQVADSVMTDAIGRYLHDKTRIVIMSHKFNFLNRFEKYLVIDDNIQEARMFHAYDELLAVYPSYGEDRECSISVPNEFCGSASAEHAPTAAHAAGDTDLLPHTKLEHGSSNLSFSLYASFFCESFEQTYKGLIIIFTIVVMMCLGLLMKVYSDWWLGQKLQMYSRTDGSCMGHSDWIWRYAGLVTLSTLAVFCSGLMIWFVCIRSSSKVHEKSLDCIIKARVNTFFDLVSSGRIISGFSFDIDYLDTYVPDVLQDLISCLFNLLSSLFLCATAVPLFLVFMAPMVTAFWWIYGYFCSSSEILRTREADHRAALLTSISETTQGLSIIRASRKQDSVMKEYYRLHDNYNTFSYHLRSTKEWLSLRLDLLSSSVVFVVSVIAWVMQCLNGDVSSQPLGLALVYSMQISALCQWIISLSTLLDSGLTSISRMGEFRAIQGEEIDLSCKIAPEIWPRDGRIKISNLKVRYRPDLPLSIKGIDVDIPSGSKIGICGRTGSGKTTLLMSLLRLVEAEPGSSIDIDGFNIFEISIRAIRRGITLIPQDPVTFAGTLRYNLDPEEIFSDNVIWSAFERIGILEDVQKRFPAGLDHEIAAGGGNVSVGQRQLFCLARAVLRNSKIILLDEATASIDADTNALIQDNLMTTFKECTVLTISHRFENILFFDKILVMQDGLVVEYGPPATLLSRITRAEFPAALFNDSFLGAQ